MLKLIIEDDEGRKTVVPFVREEITIGRQEGNTIRLTERNVSRRHARLVRSNGHVLVEDLASYNGLRVNGEKVAGQVRVQAGDLIQIGDYDLAIQDESATQPSIQGNDVGIPAAAPAIAESMEAEIETTRPRASFDLPPTERENSILPTDETPRPAPAPAPPPTTSDTQPLDRVHQATAIIRVDQMMGMTAGQIENIPLSQAPRLVVLNTE
ncbi:MAG TPA: FHA domain-containing protein, partial [Gemmatimonadaceae bacterium]|nr:FHA domain-containing protein [Gemmatimonadaceae bacterium]